MKFGFQIVIEFPWIGLISNAASIFLNIYHILRCHESPTYDTASREKFNP